ncbi:unnamed protein product [Polarella glacialis]|uniref:Uncharacterized protein n=1 Tax=Polarella glacialis TaxID=89957 RepID=A0A813FX12_POLGL|nr:unnamed protein product [Polarella glacialis]
MRAFAAATCFGVSARAFGLADVGGALFGGPSVDLCGDGLGDLRATDGPIEACRRCHGGQGMLTFNDGFADGLGYSSCGPVHTGRPETKQPSSESCGEGLGDLRTTEGPIEACGRCHGGTGMLTFNDGFADGLGYSSCGLPVMQPSSEQCGEGLGDLSATEGSLEACGRCHGGKGMLTFNDGFADGLGYSSCGPLVMQQPSSEHCGEGLGDLRATEGPIEACRRCHGGKGMLTFNDGFADGLGYSSCGPVHTGRPEMKQPSSESCGEGLGDLRTTEGPIEACGRCHGGTGMLTFNDGLADGLGYSSCGLPVMQPSSEQCGEGLGDLSATEGSLEACGRCHGGKGMLTFNDGFADGLGYSSCGPLVMQQPSSEHCGEGLGDLRATEGPIEACRRCHGGKGMLTFNDGFADGLGYSSCGPPVMQQPSSESCGEGLGDLRETLTHQEGLPAPWSETSSDTQMLATQQQQPMILWTLLVGVSGFFLLRQCTAIPEPEVRAAPLHRPVLLRSGQNFLSARKGG